MEPETVWGERWRAMAAPIARQYMTTAARSNSLVCLAADKSRISDLLTLVRSVGPFLAALKTHVDVVEDWTDEGWKEVRAAADDVDLLLFEDRKFADIGGITQKQMHGMYGIASWADLVTAHLISGPDIVDGCMAASTDVAHGREHDGVMGFIGNGSRPEEVRDLRGRVGEGRMIWTPGVNLTVGDGLMGQRYGHPRDAVLAGSDAIIVGSGIHKAEDPVAAAKAYADASWHALLERSGV